MKYIFYTIAAILFCLPARAIDVSLAANNFFAPDIGTYVEIDVMVYGASITYRQNDNDLYQGGVNITLLMKQNGEIVDFKKYTLNSIEVTEEQSLHMSLLDKQRFLLPNGVYTLEAVFTDKYDTTNTNTIEQPHIIDFDEQVTVADISLVDEYRQEEGDGTFHKSGLYMTPFVLNYYPEMINELKFYTEIYNTDLKEGLDKFLLTYSIRKTGSDKVFGKLNRYVKATATAVHPLMGVFDITKLPSGNYDLVVEVKDTDNEVLAVKKKLFHRLNTGGMVTMDNLQGMDISNTWVNRYTSEQMVFNMRSLAPISDASGAKLINKLVKSENDTLMKRYFLEFWNQRAPEDPEGAWAEHYELAKEVDREYGTNLLFGFETDRGRVTLQYGPPNTRWEAPREPGAYPYEVWHYYALDNGQNDIRFVFANFDLVTNNYELIHSTALNETRNEHWQRLIYGTFTGGNSPIEDETQMDNHFGGRASDYFQD